MEAADLSLHAELLSVCFGSHRKLRTCERMLDGYVPHRPLPSVESGRLRSGSSSQREHPRRRSATLLMAQASPKSNLLTMLMVAAAVFLGVQLFCGPKGPPPSTEQLRARYELAKHLGITAKPVPGGLEVTAVAPGSPAEPLQLQAGDQILRINGEPARSLDQLTKGMKPTTTVEVRRADGTTTTMTIRRSNALAFVRDGMAYADRLKSNAEALIGPDKQAALDAATQIEFEIAEAQYAAAELDRSFNEAVIAYQTFDRLAKEFENTELGNRAKVGRDASRALAAQLPKGSFIQFGYNAIDWLVAATGRVPGFSYWFAAFFLSLVVRALVWPLATKQIISFKRMALLQPMIKELQEKYQGAELQTRVMKLYQKYGINPLAGCWPMLIQLPFFIWVFYCMNAYRFEFQSGTFLWVNPATAKMLPSIIAPNLGERDVPLVILYGISMIVSTFVTPADPQNVRQTRMIGAIMAITFTAIMLMPFAPFPSAFVIYWIGINVLSTIQSIYLSRKPIPPLVEVPESERKKGMFAGLTPTDGTQSNGKEIKPRDRTGAPKLHKPKKKKK